MDLGQPILQGTVKGGVVVLDGEAMLAEGTRVRVSPAPVNEESPDDTPKIDSIYQIFELAGPGGIPDLSRNLDHYLYGHPKVGDADA